MGFIIVFTNAINFLNPLCLKKLSIHGRERNRRRTKREWSEDARGFSVKIGEKENLSKMKGMPN